MSGDVATDCRLLLLLPLLVLVALPAARGCCLVDVGGGGSDGDGDLLGSGPPSSSNFTQFVVFGGAVGSVVPLLLLTPDNGGPIPPVVAALLFCWAGDALRSSFGSPTPPLDCCFCSIVFVAFASFSAPSMRNVCVELFLRSSQRLPRGGNETTAGGQRKTHFVSPTVSAQQYGGGGLVEEIPTARV